MLLMQEIWGRRESCQDVGVVGGDAGRFLLEGGHVKNVLGPDVLAGLRQGMLRRSLAPTKHVRRVPSG